MGRALGYFADGDETDRPELNKCPDCACFFDGDTCPLCGKVCPDEYKAGNRKPVKKTKRSSGGSQRTQFIDWYYSWWFIALMILFFPIVGLILLFTSPHTKKSKIIATVIIVIYVLFFRLGGIYSLLSLSDLIGNYKLAHPGITAAELKTEAESVDPSDFLHYPDAYKDRYVKMELTVVTSVGDSSDYTKYYVCTPDGTNRVLVRDCMKEDKLRLLDGETVTVYGIAAGEKTVWLTGELSAPCINMYAAEIEK